jgi:hypothetical protein
MPRPGPRRPLIAVRLDEPDREDLQQRADNEAEGNLSELVRRMVKYSMTRMPRGWKP